ncbi:hypothetical protein RF007C_02960 [Ruminococcus flavefaciens 007c]|uniref:Uncharacterized protein n=1 Tax=Ruminococcus flavefaciens 007c TaxID=1341157 RepID=W7UUX7_RUMFL|nr:hypothetical protein RF007C_02960 [Ruminococcus flavefaciens 007c]
MQQGVYCAAIGISEKKRERFREPQVGTAKYSAASGGYSEGIIAQRSEYSMRKASAAQMSAADLRD